MMPLSRTARTVFVITLSITGLLLIVSVGATIWSQVGEEGWVSKAVIALVSWCLTAPFIVTSAIWSIILSATKSSRLEKFNEKAKL